MLSRLARRTAALAMVCVAALSPLCASAQPAEPTPAPAAAPAAAGIERPANVGADYRLGPGDKIRVIVFGEESLSGQFVVAGNGKVALPLIGEISAQNLSVPEFQEAVVAALSQGYLREPRVSAEVLTYRPFYILGEVNKPGEYPYSNGLTVLNAVATAGGFTYRAQTKKVYIRRHADVAEKAYPLAPETRVAPGDTIRVVERFF